MNKYVILLKNGERALIEADDFRICETNINKPIRFFTIDKNDIVTEHNVAFFNQNNIAGFFKKPE